MSADSGATKAAHRGSTRDNVNNALLFSELIITYWEERLGKRKNSGGLDWPGANVSPLKALLLSAHDAPTTRQSPFT